MANIWLPNEEHSEEDELVVTDHRDPNIGGEVPDDERPIEEQLTIEATEDDARESLEALGEDVASSPARRGQEHAQNDTTTEGVAPDVGER